MPPVPADNSDEDASREETPHRPVIPLAAPILDAEGRLTYVGCDGRRYVVADPPEP